MRSDLALAALASAAVPGMKPVSVAGVDLPDEGREPDLQTAVVEDATGRRWTVRAPLSPVAGARLARNDELVRQLARHVPFKVPAAAGYAPLGKDGSAAVYAYVEGSPLDLHRLPGGHGLASAVGRALAAIHNIPRGVFEEQDVPVYDAGGARQRIIAEVDRAAETGRVPTGLLARWEEAFDAAPMWQFATTPVHGRFTGDCVLVAFTDEDDAASGRVVAVTDWDEAMVGDPAVDLAALRSQSSPEAWEAVLESYTLARTHRPDAYLHARARLVAELRHLRGLARAVAEDDEDGIRRAVEALRRADRLTEADDSLVPVTARPSGTTQPRPAGAVAPVEHPGQEPDPGVAPVAAAEPEEAPVTDPDATMEVPAPREEPEADGAPTDPAVDPAAAETGALVEVEDADESEHDDADEEEDQAPEQPSAEAVVEDTSDEAGTDEGPGSVTDGDRVDDHLVEGRDPGHGDADGGGANHAEGGGADDGDGGGADDGDSGGAEDTVAGEDTERLHELYGMPDPARDRDGR